MDKISDIRFNLTKEMAEEIIKVNNFKKQLLYLQKKINEVTEENELFLLTNKSSDIKTEIEESKKRFIKEFQKHNKKQITDYLASKNN